MISLNEKGKLLLLIVKGSKGWICSPGQGNQDPVTQLLFCCVVGYAQ